MSEKEPTPREAYKAARKVVCVGCPFNNSVVGCTIKVSPDRIIELGRTGVKCTRTNIQSSNRRLLEGE